MIKKSLFLAFVLAMGLVSQSRAGTWSFNYSGAGVEASGVITTGAAVSTFGDGPGFIITGITGERNGVAITGLAQVANNPALSPGHTTSSDGKWWFDNVMLSSGGLDLWGILFLTADQKEYNIYNDHGQYIDGYYNTSSRNCGYELKDVKMSVPESGTTVSLFGVALLGLAMLRRRFVR